MDNAKTSLAADITRPRSPFAGFEEIQTKLRHAVEDRDYGLALALIDEQRSLFDRADRTSPETHRHARTAHELCVWALSLVRLQREQLNQNLEELSARKRVISCYAAAIPFTL